MPRAPELVRRFLFTGDRTADPPGACCSREPFYTGRDRELFREADAPETGRTTEKNEGAEGQIARRIAAVGCNDRTFPQTTGSPPAAAGHRTESQPDDHPDGDLAE